MDVSNYDLVDSLQYQFDGGQPFNVMGCDDGMKMVLIDGEPRCIPSSEETVTVEMPKTEVLKKSAAKREGDTEEEETVTVNKKKLIKWLIVAGVIGGAFYLYKRYNPKIILEKGGGVPTSNPTPTPAPTPAPAAAPAAVPTPAPAAAPVPEPTFPA
jgi:hypothetical protein